MEVPIGGTGSGPWAWRLRVRTLHAQIRFTQGQCMFWGFWSQMAVWAHGGPYEGHRQWPWAWRLRVRIPHA